MPSLVGDRHTYAILPRLGTNISYAFPAALPRTPKSRLPGGARQLPSPPTIRRGNWLMTTGLHLCACPGLRSIMRSKRYMVGRLDRGGAVKIMRPCPGGGEIEIRLSKRHCRGAIATKAIHTFLRWHDGLLRGALSSGRPLCADSLARNDGELQCAALSPWGLRVEPIAGAEQLIQITLSRERPSGECAPTDTDSIWGLDAVSRSRARLSGAVRIGCCWPMVVPRGPRRIIISPKSPGCTDRSYFSACPIRGIAGGAGPFSRSSAAADRQCRPWFGLCDCGGATGR